MKKSGILSLGHSTQPQPQVCICWMVTALSLFVKQPELSQALASLNTHSWELVFHETVASVSRFHFPPHSLTFDSVLLHSVSEVCGWVVSCEYSGSLTEAEAWRRPPPVALSMCSTCRVRPCMLQPFSSLTAASADWGPLVITAANLRHKATSVSSFQK